MATSPKFTSPTRGEVSLSELVDFVREYICCDGFEHKIIVGTDSSPANEKGRTFLVTAVVVHRVGRGGIYYWTQSARNDLQELCNRMYAEALRSIEVAQQLIEHGLIPIEDSNGELEIHVDVGPNGPTRKMIQELVGMVKGSGFLVKTKPSSFAASKVADRHT